MSQSLFSFSTAAFNAVGTTLFALMASITSFFGFAGTPAPAVVVPSSSEMGVTISASSTPAVSAVPARIPKKIPAVVPAVVPASAVPAAHPGADIPSPDNPDTEHRKVGPTTLAVQSVPLLVGGVVRAGGTVPVSYLQITNVGNEGTVLKGFWLKQNGSASVESIVALATVDDRGGSRGRAGRTEGVALFQNGAALAPTDAYFAPGQMRLFTVKATMSPDVSQHIGAQLVIDVASLETEAEVRGQFPIRGTTWVIAN